MTLAQLHRQRVMGRSMMLMTLQRGLRIVEPFWQESRDVLWGDILIGRIDYILTPHLRRRYRYYGTFEDKWMIDRHGWDIAGTLIDSAEVQAFMLADYLLPPATRRAISDEVTQ